MRKKRKIFNFCPYCGSTRLVRDLPKGWKNLHKLCLNCGKRWEIRIDSYNDFGIG